jgi:uracil-DNA glycosylase family 4
MICTRCSLHKTRRCITEPIGATNPSLLFISQYPSVAGEITGTTYAVRELKIIERLLQDALEPKPIPTFQCVSIVLCRPTDTKYGTTREPRKEEILSCLSNIFTLITLARPKKIILIGNLVERYYAKEFPDAVKIQSLEFLLRQGGPMSAWYNMNVRTLSEALKNI